MDKTALARVRQVASIDLIRSKKNNIDSTSLQTLVNLVAGVRPTTQQGQAVAKPVVLAVDTQVALEKAAGREVVAPEEPIRLTTVLMIK
jgi:hypothetical protein